MANCVKCGLEIPLLERRFGDYLQKCKACIKKDMEQIAKQEEEQRQSQKKIKDEQQRALLTEEDKSIIDLPFVTTESFASKNIIKTIGMARGSTVRAKHIGRDFMADVKSLVGGELKGYTELLAEGREEALYRMKEDAYRMGANAIVSVRFSTSAIGLGISEIFAYGTAVKIETEV